jgi:hypothetical protein
MREEQKSYEQVYQTFLLSYRGLSLQKKLKINEEIILINFLQTADELGFGPNEFEFKTNRLFLDNPNKPKNWSVICEILSCVNTRKWA